LEIASSGTLALARLAQLAHQPALLQSETLSPMQPGPVSRGERRMKGSEMKNAGSGLVVCVLLSRSEDKIARDADHHAGCEAITNPN
jgi:hypothetical protein